MRVCVVIMVLLGDWCASIEARSGLTLISLRASDKRAVSGGQKRLTRPISASAPLSWGLRMRILVIEDERTLAGFIDQSLRAEGHAVTVCTTATAARRRR